jgi:hypothetical protein
MKTFQEYINEFKMPEDKGDIRQEIKDIMKQLLASGNISWFKNQFSNILINIMSKEDLIKLKTQLEHFSTKDLSIK